MASNLYWLVVLGNIRESFVIMICLMSVILLIFALDLFSSKNEKSKEAKEKSKSFLCKFFLCFMILILITIFIPSKKELILIGTVKAVESNENLNTLMDKGLNVLDKTFEKVYEDEKE